MFLHHHTRLWNLFVLFVLQRYASCLKLHCRTLMEFVLLQDKDDTIHIAARLQYYHILHAAQADPVTGVAPTIFAVCIQFGLCY